MKFEKMNTVQEVRGTLQLVVPSIKSLMVEAERGSHEQLYLLGVYTAYSQFLEMLGDEDG